MTTAERKAFAAECDRRREEGLKVFGAYALKDRIKAAGGIWDGRLKAWLIPSHEVADELGLVFRTGRHGAYYTTATARQSTRRRAPRTECCRACGGNGSVEAERGECASCGTDFDAF